MSVTIILADDHAIMRDGLQAIIASQADYKVVAHAANGVQVVDLAAQLCPDVVIMDIGMPDLNGVEATRRILRADPKVRVVALSTYNDRHFVKAMMDAGARAYVVKSSATEYLLTAVREVMAGQVYLSPEVANAVLPNPPGTSGQSALDLLSDLTSREVEVLQLVAEGHSSRAISDKLGIAEDTVDVHRRNIMRKLDLHNVAELTRYAIRAGLTSA
jgi:two-component system NarL family response regulator